LTVLFIIGFNSLLTTRALCGCMGNALVLKTRSTGAVVAGIQKIFSHSSCKSANSFFYLTRRSQSSLSFSSRFRSIVIIILYLQKSECRVLENFKDLSLRTGTVLDDKHFPCCQQYCL